MATAVSGLIGRKLGMTQVYTAAGVLVPVTVIEAGPCTVVAMRNAERNGYAAAQLGFGAVAEKRLTKPVQGQFKKAGTTGLGLRRAVALAAGDRPPLAPPPPPPDLLS